MSKLATKQDLNKIIEKAVKRIGKDQANIRDTEGVTITNEDIKKEREVVIEESLKEAANEAAETLVLENTITGMVKDILGEQKPKDIDEPKVEQKIVNENTTGMIKKLVSKKLKNISEEKTTTPSLDQVKKHRDESNTETKKYHKDTAKKLKEYGESDNAEENSPMHRNNEDQEEFIEDWRGMGLEDAEGVGDLERLEAYLGGSSETGNAQVDEDGNDLGNVVSTDLGKKIEKKIERKKEKTETQKSHMRNARGYSPAVQKTVKESVNESVKADMTKITELFNYNKKTQ